MTKKLSLAVAAFAVALSLQAAFAADNRPAPRDPSMDEYCRPDGPGFGEGRRGGPRGRFGHGPAMSPHHMMGMGPGRGMGPGMHGFGPRFMGELELTDAQKSQLVDAMTANFREGLLARMEMADAHRKLRELSRSENPDDAAIIAANEALGAARGKMEVLFRKAGEDLKKVLTPEQQAKLDEMKAERGPGRRPGRFDDRDDEDGPRGRRPMPPRDGFGRGPRGMGRCY